ncbi:MAG: restriction endonuclease subunit S [Betaproteobacteria bacterium]|nr:restriction endonuclease subunit S [Betaproteobacteria bacterium]
MEVKEASAKYSRATGYKQTEVGVIPEDWECAAIGSAIDLLTGFPFPSSGYSKSGVRLLRGSNVKRGVTDWSEDDTEYWPAITADIRKYILKAGDVVIAMDGSLVGRSFAMLSSDDVPALLLQRVARIRSEAIAQKYLKAWICSHRFTEHCDAVKTVTAIPHISPADIKSFKVGLPPTKAEQEAIAGALSDADALIESLEQLLAKKRQIKQGAMQELLTGKRRLPGFSGEWEERTLFELAGRRKDLFDDGDWIESEHITDKGIRIVQTGNIGVGAFVDKDDKKYIFEKSFISLHCKEISHGDLLICRLADPAGRSCVLPDIGEAKIVTSVDVTIFRPPASVANRVFLTNIFSTDQWFRAVSDRSGGTTHKRISRGALGRLRIRVPSVAEQSAIAAILSDMDAELTALEEKLAKARAIKQGMMQELLTGRIRLV